MHQETRERCAEGLKQCEKREIEQCQEKRGTGTIEEDIFLHMYVVTINIYCTYFTFEVCMYFV
jgi:hypothetical protein